MTVKYWTPPVDERMCRCGHIASEHEMAAVILYGKLHKEIGVDQPNIWRADCQVEVGAWKLCDCMQFKEGK